MVNKGLKDFKVFSFCLNALKKHIGLKHNWKIYFKAGPPDGDVEMIFEVEGSPLLLFYKVYMFVYNRCHIEEDEDTRNEDE